MQNVHTSSVVHSFTVAYDQNLCA